MTDDRTGGGPSWAGLRVPASALNIFLGFLLLSAFVTLDVVVRADSQGATSGSVAEPQGSAQSVPGDINPGDAWIDVLSPATGPAAPTNGPGPVTITVPAMPVASPRPAAIAAPGPVAPGAVSLPPSGSISFGMDAGSIDAQRAAGARPDYATFWIGAWTLSSGWGGPDRQLDLLESKGVTPAIHFYYWGNDISADCLENGCQSTLHNAHKDRAGWQTLAQQLVDHLNARLEGKSVLIILETEFNKAQVARYEPLDGYLAEKADFFHQGYPAAKVVMALGNWYSPAWSTWDRAAAASDYVGLQSMRGYTRDALDGYLSAYDTALEGARTARDLFGKPVVIHDLALAADGPDSRQWQRDALQRFFAGAPDLARAGVEAILYRSWQDAPNAVTLEYYGEAERHMGLVEASTSSPKPAAGVWTEGVLAIRAG